MRRRPLWPWIIVCFVALLSLKGVGAAQEITVRPQPPPPSRREFRLEPLLSPDRTQIREQDFRPDQQAADHAPALIHPLTGQARVGAKQVIRFGASGWTAPHEVGSSQIERNGGVAAFGLTFVFGVPEEETPPRSR